MKTNEEKKILAEEIKVLVDQLNAKISEGKECGLLVSIQQRTIFGSNPKDRQLLVWVKEEIEYL